MNTNERWDSHGNYLGKDVSFIDRDGLTHIIHYDNHNNRVGRSYETTDIWGKVFMVHEDADGNRLATSTLEQDWWGDYYVKTEQTQYAHEQAEAERKKKCEPETRKDNADDDAGIVIKVLSAIIMVPVAIFVCLLIGAICLNIVGIAAVTIWPFVIMGLLNMIIGVVPIGLLFFVLGGIVLSYFPYIGILLYRRWKKEIAWKDFFLAVLRWAIIGPFAYRRLLRKEKEKTKEHNPHRPYELPLWQCPTCKNSIFTSGQFCPQCGTARPEKPSSVTVLCPNCSKPIFPATGKEKVDFCRECGKPYNLEEN